MLSANPPTSTKNWKRPGIGASDEELLRAQELSRKFLAENRTFFTIDSSVNFEQLKFDIDELGFAPADVSVVGSTFVLALLLFGKEIVHMLKSKFTTKDGVMVTAKMVGLLGASAAMNLFPALNSKTEGSLGATLAGEFDSLYSQITEGVDSPNGYIGFDELLVVFRNTIMAQNIKRIVAIYGGTAGYEKQFIGAGGGHSEIWNFIHQDLPGRNEERIREYISRLFDSVVNGFVTADHTKFGDHTPMQYAAMLAPYCAIFNDYQLAGNVMDSQEILTPAMLAIYDPNLVDDRLIPMSPRMLLIETIRQRLIDAKNANDPFQVEVFSNLALLVFKQEYDECAVLQEQAEYWNCNREGFISPYDNSTVQKIAANLLTKYENGYLGNVLIYADYYLDAGVSHEINMRDTCVSSETSDIILGAAFHNGKTIPLVRKFSPSLMNQKHANDGSAFTKPEKIEAQDGFMLPGGVFIPISAQKITYTRMPPDYQRVETNERHTTIVGHALDLHPVELIRAKTRVQRVSADGSPAILYVREGSDRDTQLNIDELLLC